MASTRPLKLDEWGISWEEYKELTYFCLQYNRKKADAAALLTIKLSTPTPAIYHKNVGDKMVEFGTFMPHGSGHVSDPEPVYPTFREWLISIGVIGQMSTHSVIADKLAMTPIPADIAEKLGVMPKEGV